MKLFLERLADGKWIALKKLKYEQIEKLKSQFKKLYICIRANMVRGLGFLIVLKANIRLGLGSPVSFLIGLKNFRI